MDKQSAPSGEYVDWSEEELGVLAELKGETPPQGAAQTPPGDPAVATPPAAETPPQPVSEPSETAAAETAQPQAPPEEDDDAGEEGGEEGGEDGRSETVSFKRFDKERRKRKEMEQALEASAARHREEQAAQREHFNKLIELTRAAVTQPGGRAGAAPGDPASAQPADPQAAEAAQFQQAMALVRQGRPEGSYDDNPQGHEAFNRAQDWVVRGMLTERAAGQREAAQATQAQEVETFLRSQEAAFREATPDYGAASQHLVTRETARYQAMGLTPEAAQQKVRADLMAVVRLAAGQRANPAARIYALAEAHGYQKAVEPAPSSEPAAAAPATPSPAPDDAAARAAEATERLATQAEGQRRARSLSGAQGGAAKRALTMEYLATLQPHEMDALPRAEVDAFWRQQLGG